MEIYLTRPQKEDVKELRKLFLSVIADAFKQDGLNDDAGVQEEVAKQMKLLNKDFASQGSQAFFLIACTEEQIIGTLAYSEPNSLIRSNLQIDFTNIPEVTSVYVLPEFQGMGVGSLLYNAILISLHHNKMNAFCLDAGYKKSQCFWMNKLGNPTVTLPDYWSKGLDHLIWLRNLRDVKIRYQIISRRG